jgi:hypothetical protein
MLRKLPDDPEIEEMDPLIRTWMFYNWIEDYTDEYKMLENQGYLIASFIDPEGVRKLIGQDSSTHASTDEEFEATSRKIREANKQLRANDGKTEKSGKRKRKRKIVE